MIQQGQLSAVRATLGQQGLCIAKRAGHRVGWGESKGRWNSALSSSVSKWQRAKDSLASVFVVPYFLPNLRGLRMSLVLEFQLGQEIRRRRHGATCL